MKTTATNRKIRVLIQDLTEGKLVPNPTFQRRLVWTPTHKYAFLETILLGLPFPEIYIAAGEIDPNTAEGTEMLVDGQQRITTIFQYFRGTVDIKYSLMVPPYEQLSKEAKRAFLEYEVVVRDLGSVDIEEIKEVFQRINSTKYSLNAMEIQNARYEGAFKEFGDRIAQHRFFDTNRVFTSADFRRMHDTRFVLTLVATMMAGYFNQDAELENFLQNYSVDFPMAENIEKRLGAVFTFIDACAFERSLRLWNRADLLTLIVELDRVINGGGRKLNAKRIGSFLAGFYRAVDDADMRRQSNFISDYYNAAVQGTNAKANRIARGEIIASLLQSPQAYASGT